MLLIGAAWVALSLRRTADQISRRVDEPRVYGTAASPPARHPQRSTDEPPAERVATHAIRAEFRADKVAADRKYTGKVVEVTGTVCAMSGDAGTGLVWLGDPDAGERHTVHAFSLDQHGEDLAALSRFQPVLITGVYIGLADDGCVEFGKCRVQPLRGAK
jgi:hypothetical protein